MVNIGSDCERAARRFLRTGRLGGRTPAELAASCDQLVRRETERSARRAVGLGEQFVRRARAADRTMLPVALRALGWAYVVAGKYQPAAARYLEARRATRDPLARARIDRILIDVYMYLGRHDEALRRGRRAIAVFRGRKAEADLAKTEVNCANVLHRLDRHPEALPLYRRAGAFFASQGDELAAAFCRYNEANTLVQLFHFAAAEKLYSSAREVFLRHDHRLRAAGCLYGLAWLHMLEGRFHAALQELAECEAHYRAAGQAREHLLCVLDRAETYLSLNLLPDARDTARRAAMLARRLGLRYEQAKAEFFRGKALAALGRMKAGRTAFRTAAAGFRREGNEGFLAAVRVAEAVAGESGRARARALAALRERMPQGRLPLWEALCDLEILSAAPEDGGARRRLAANRAVETMPHVRAQYVTLLGDSEARRGRRRAATGHWRRAAEILTAVRAQLPPLDLRAAFSERHAEPYEKLIACEWEAHPSQAAAWLERFHTAGIWATEDARLDDPARTQAEQSLASLARYVAAAAQRSDGRRVRGGGAAPATSLRRQLEEQIRTDLARLERRRGSAAERLDRLGAEIAAASRTMRLVQLHAVSGDIIGLIHEEGRPRGCRLEGAAPAVERLLQRWRFFVERAPYRTAGETAADLADERRLLARLAETLWRPLDVGGPQPVLIVADGALANLPWAALPVGGRPLIDRHPLVMAPSVRHHLAAARQRTQSRETRIFVGAAGLGAAGAEYAPLLADERRQTTVHNPCGRADWPVDSEADVWHFTGHAHFRSDNPFYSFLELADGPLFAADFRLRRNTVNLAVLAACRTGLSSFLPGEESTGLIRALLEMGARNVLASHWAVADASTARWIERFYGALAEGSGPAAAVQRAAADAREEYPSAYDWAGFSLFGAG